MELPERPVIVELVTRYARLLAARGDEMGERPLVLPNSRFFPDTFTPDPASVNRLLGRMALHAGMTDIPVRAEVAFELESSGGTGGSCSSGACAPRLAVEGARSTGVFDGGAEGWIVLVPEVELRHAVALTTRLARALGEIFIEETAENARPAPAEEAAVEAELCAVALGFGVLLLEGSHVYSKSCGGPSVAQLTELSCPELAVAFALFVCRGDHSRRTASKELSATQLALVDSALDLLLSNKPVLTDLKQAPERLVPGVFSLGEAQPGLLRWLGGRKSKLSPEAELEAELAKLAASKSAARSAAADPKRDELRALVDEAFASGGAVRE